MSQGHDDKFIPKKKKKPHSELHHMHMHYFAATKDSVPSFLSMVSLALSMRVGIFETPQVNPR